MGHKAYVVGFLFDPVYERVVLIRKAAPFWQRGGVNGVGGKIEPRETAYEAMQREFQEETDSVHSHVWTEYARLKGTDDKGDKFTVVFFCAVDHGYLPADRCSPAELQMLPQGNSEIVFVGYVSDLPKYPCIPNLSWLVPMAINRLRGVDRCKVFVMEEHYTDSFSALSVFHDV